MRTKRSLLFGSILLGLAILIACLAWANSAWLLTPLWAAIRLGQIQNEMKAVPTLQNTSLIDRVEGISPSGVYGCASVYVNELVGSNSLSVIDAVHALDAALPSDIRRTGRIYKNENGARYQWTRDVSLLLGDFAIEKVLSRFDEEVSTKAEQTYKTLFVIALWQPVYPDGFENRCH
jgi:hypothetical protein